MKTNNMQLVKTIGMCGVWLAVIASAASAQETGTVLGLVFDASTGSPVRQARVEVEGTDLTAVTDTDGAYQVTLPPGTYRITITANRYLPTTIENLTVTSGEAADGSAVLASEGAVTQVEVTATVDAAAATAASVVLERKLASTVSDAISAEEISRSTASDAAAALEKVTGVSVVNDGYVYVRGLGERYSATMLNNAMITTTEPEKRVVPLDLFPSNLIDSIKVIKTYSADLPGEFSGGLVQMKTVEFPKSRILRVSFSSGMNTQTTGKSFQTYPGGGSDFFGFDDGARDLPSQIPADDRLFRGRFSDEQLAEFGRSFSPVWQVDPVGSARPNQTYSILAGNTFGKLGLIGAVTFSNGLTRHPEIQRFFRTQGPGEQLVFTNYEDYRADNEAARLGGILNVSYRFTEKHKISVRNTFTQDAEKEGRLFSGFSGGIDAFITNERLRWIERGIFATQIEGEHLTPLWSSIFTWQLGMSQSRRDEPDLREVSRILRPDGSFDFLATTDSGLRFFSNLDEMLYEPMGAWQVPFYRGPIVGNFSVGFRATFRDREFSSRRFRFQPAPGARLDFSLPSNELFAPENIDARNGFQLREITRGTDAYNADMTIYGGFFNFDVALGSRWRVVAGLRVEDAEQNVITADPLNPFAQPIISSLDNRDPLPAVNVIYSLTPQQNLRFGWGQTLSRPDFRELSPFEFTDIVGGLATVGNAGLTRTKIQNFDGRWEWFFGGDQLAAVSYFYKEFTDPIELVIEPGVTQRRTWVNAAGAKNQGVEFEYRRTLAALSPALKDFAVSSNFTVVDSEINIPPDINTPVTNRTRPLAGQSRYIFNGALEWLKPRWRSSARLFANYVSRRISEVGSFGLDDVFQTGRTNLDVVYEYQLREAGDWKLRFAAENLTDEHFLWTQGGETKRLFNLGRTFKVGLSFSLLY